MIEVLVGDSANYFRQLESHQPFAAPDILVTECLGVLRRDERRRRVTDQRASLAVTDLGDLGVSMFPTSPMRARVWSLRHNLTVSDAMFVVLAERLGETLVTRDRRLADAARRHAGIDVIVLSR